MDPKSGPNSSFCAFYLWPPRGLPQVTAAGDALAQAVEQRARGEVRARRGNCVTRGLRTNGVTSEICLQWTDRICWSRVMHKKFTGLAQILGQLQASIIIGIVSRHNAGQTCECWANPVRFSG
jgi:hypothetical protein